MKILVLNWQDIRNPQGGGAEVHLHEIFKRIAARGHSVTLFCSRFPGAPAEEVIDGIRVIREGGRNLFNYRVYPKYLRQFRHERYDVVVDDVNKIPFFTPLFVKEPLAGILHHLFGKSIFSETFFLPALYVLGAEKLALRVYRKTPMAVVSESTRQELLGSGFDDGLLSLVPNCVDQALYTPAGQPPQPNLIGYLGRLKKYKSVEDLLSAVAVVLKETPDVRLVILGDGDARPSLERVADDLRITSHVDFLGYVPPAEKIRRLHSMSVVVNTSAKEGWGLTVIEANACGVPVIASDVPGLRDSVIHEKTGLLYEYGNIEELAEKILLILRDNNLRSRLSNEAVLWARQFNWERSADSMIGFLEGVIRNRRGE
ncbi:MAG: glycosyltransferase family 4 protein [Bacteroidota bacterium]